MSHFFDKRQKVYEEYAYILDYLPFGLGHGRREASRGPVAQAIGEKFFMLLELAPIPGLELKVGDRIPLGRDLESQLLRVTRRLTYDELTASAKAELPEIIRQIVLQREREFVEFFNKAEPLTTRMHSLELLPGIGKRLLWKILEERKKKPFESFKDIYERIKIDPVKIICERILEELRTEQRHYLFVKPFHRPRLEFEERRGGSFGPRPPPSGA
jgi:putative nucleotide binding protein